MLIYWVYLFFTAFNQMLIASQQYPLIHVGLNFIDQPLAFTGDIQSFVHTSFYFIDQPLNLADAVLHFAIDIQNLAGEGLNFASEGLSFAANILNPTDETQSLVDEGLSFTDKNSQLVAPLVFYCRASSCFSAHQLQTQTALN